MFFNIERNPEHLKKMQMSFFISLMLATGHVLSVIVNANVLLLSSTLTERPISHLQLQNMQVLC